MTSIAMQLDLTKKEAAELTNLLDAAVSDLSPEIAGTDNPAYRAGLRDRRESLRSIRSKLGN